MSSSAWRVSVWRSRKQGTEPPYHGTANIYNAYGCRCDECRAAAARKQRRYQQRKRESNHAAS